MARAEFVGRDGGGTRVLAFGPPDVVPGARIALPSGFLPGHTTVETPGGPLPAAALRAGSLVRTLDGEAEPVRWIGRFPTAEARVAMAALPKGGALPEDQLILLAHPRLLRFCGSPQALVRAADLGAPDMPRVDPARPAPDVLVCPVFARPIALRLDGVPVASFVADGDGIAALPSALRRDLLRALPEFRYPAGQAGHWPIAPRITAADLARLGHA